MGHRASPRVPAIVRPQRFWYRSKGYATIRSRGTGEAQMQANNLYGGQDPREMPAYSIPEAAHYLQIPPSTLRSWTKGWRYPTRAGEKRSAPLITPPAAPEQGPLLLSFVNVVE